LWREKLKGIDTRRAATRMDIPISLNLKNAMILDVIARDMSENKLQYRAKTTTHLSLKKLKPLCSSIGYPKNVSFRKTFNLLGMPLFALKYEIKKL
jgi:predicted HTH domain antitoxin